jgi:hypothetical protein
MSAGLTRDTNGRGIGPGRGHAARGEQRPRPARTIDRKILEKGLSINKEQIRNGLGSGRLHPFPLLEHLSREGDREGVRLVTEIGPRFVYGSERLGFNALFCRVALETLAPSDAQRAEASKRRAERTKALGSALKNKVAYDREKKMSLGKPSSPGGWNLPLDA